MTKPLEAPPRDTAAAGRVLVDRELRSLLGRACLLAPDAPPFDARQISPASLDLRLGARAWRVRSGFLPSAARIETRIDELALAEVSLARGALLERGVPYVAEIEERLELPATLAARFNPRSSTGRCDVFTRVLAEGHARFDEAPAGYRGRLWIEIAPLSFPVRIARGDRLAQVRLSEGDPALAPDEVRALQGTSPFLWRDGAAVPAAALPLEPDGTLVLGVGLAGRDPAGWRALAQAGAVDIAAEGAHAARDFFEPVHAPAGRCTLEPGSFHVFASRERLALPPRIAAEMLPIDVGIGELRNNYAGFFDNGFGWRRDDERRGTPAVLEVRAHDVPFLVEDGQPFCRLRLYRTGQPDRLYGDDRPASYRNQELMLARCFRPA